MNGIAITTTRSSAPLLPWLRNLMLSIHNVERWFGKRPDQSGNIWALEAELDPFTGISGLGDWGSDPDDEALAWGSGNTFPIAGNTCYGIIRALITENSEDTPCLLRFIWGSGTMLEAIAAEQFSTAAIQNITSGSKAGGSPFNIMVPMLKIGVDKLWMQVKSTIDNHQVSFLVGVHAYPYCF